MNMEDSTVASSAGGGYVCIYIDSRETALQSFFQKRYEWYQIQSMNIQCRFEPLDIGDIRIEMIQEDGTRKGAPLVFERKTIQDLASSMKDGRYREQKARLLASYPAKRITYILEDCPSGPSGGLWSQSVTKLYGIARKAYGSFIIHSMYRDNMHVYLSKNVEETGLFLENIADRFQRHPESFLHLDSHLQQDVQTEGEREPVGGGGVTSYVDVCAMKSRKIENITPHVCFLLQLGQIPGISAKIAKQIAEFSGCSTMAQWMQRMSECVTYTDKLKYLSEIPNIGKKKAERMLTYLGFSQ